MQWIATRTDNPHVRDEFERYRGEDQFDLEQWPDDDFEPIGRAFDEHFQLRVERIHAGDTEASYWP
jgi:hypothetical protein